MITKRKDVYLSSILSLNLQFIMEGVTYSNGRQTEDMRKEILSGGIDYESVHSFI